jgi:RNA polymerase sigma-70 factor (ECF subfamily)
MALENEALLIEKASRGDVRSFETLVKEYEKSVYNLALRMVSNKEDAMDIVQEVFLKAYQALPSFRGDSRFSTWIYRVSVNASLDHIRKNQKGKVYSLDEPLTFKESSIQRELPDDSVSIEYLVESKDLGDTVLSSLSYIDPDQRAVVLLCDVQGYTYQEIADMLEISIGTVKSRLHRARNALRKLLKREQISPSDVKSDRRRDQG